MRKILSALCLASLTWAAGGCADPLDEEPEVESSQFALNGDVVIWNGTCTAAETDKLRQSLALLRSWVVDRPDAMRRCLEESVLGGPENDSLSFDGDGYPEWIMWKLAEQIPTEIECNPTTGPAAGPNPKEHINVGPWNINMPVDELAGLLLHEISHTKGFDHPSGAEYSRSIPIALQTCLSGAVAGDARPVDFERRSEMIQESRLAGVGIRQGQPVESSCWGDRFAVAIFGHESGTGVERLGLACKARGADKPTVDEQAFGSATGTSFRQSCFPGEVMVGAWGLGDRELRAVGPMCALESAVGQAGQYNDPTHGGAGNLLWSRRCPLGMAVKGMRIRTAGWYTGRLRWLELECQNFDRPQHVSRWQLSELGGDSGYGYGNREECAGRAALVGVHTFVGPAETLVRLSGSCAQIGSGGGQNWLAGGWWHILPGFGGARYAGAGDVVASDYCDSSQALVGMRINHDSQIRAVQGICAPVTPWSAGQPVSYQYLPQRGAAQPTGTWTEQICPYNMLVDGFYMEANQRVNSLAVQCRGFHGESGHPR